MGEFAPSPESAEPGVPEAPYLRLLSGMDTAERFDGLDRVIDYRAPKFFRIDTGPEIVPIPDTDEKRLWILRLTLKTVPELNKDNNGWVQEKRAKSIRSIETTQGRKLVLPESLLRGVVDPPETYFDAYKTPCIKTRIVHYLDEIGDPIVAIIDRYERWRQEKETTEENRAKTRRAYEHFLFGASGPDFLKLIKAVTIEQFERHTRANERRETQGPSAAD